MFYILHQHACEDETDGVFWIVGI